MQSLNGKSTGNTLTAAEWNQLPSEVQNVITAVGLTLAGGDLNQLGKAIAAYVANGSFYIDSGAADAYVLAPVGSQVAPGSYRDGMQVRFNATNANTGGAATVNVASLGVKSIKTQAGTDPVAGSIDGVVSLQYNSGAGYFELYTAAQLGIAQTFTAGQAGKPVNFPATTGTVTLDLADGNNHHGTLSGDITLANPDGIAEQIGQTILIRIVNGSGAGPYTIAYGSFWRGPGGTLPSLTATDAAVDEFVAYVESATQITILSAAQDVS